MTKTEKELRKIVEEQKWLIEEYRKMIELRDKTPYVNPYCPHTYGPYYYHYHPQNYPTWYVKQGDSVIYSSNSWNAASLVTNDDSYGVESCS